MIYIGLSSWIIQDGNYGDFRVGQIAKFALEFNPISLLRAQSYEKHFEHVKLDRYWIRGQVVYADATACVIDFGLMAYKYRHLPGIATTGTWIEGEISLAVDPMFYFKELHARPGMPALQYDWRIKGISLETTPWLTTKNESGGHTLTRDESKKSFKEIAETHAWDDDDGNAEYVLECEKLT